MERPSALKPPHKDAQTYVYTSASTTITYRGWFGDFPYPIKPAKEGDWNQFTAFAGQYKTNVNLFHLLKAEYGSRFAQDAVASLRQEYERLKAENPILLPRIELFDEQVLPYLEELEAIAKAEPQVSTETPIPFSENFAHFAFFSGFIGSCLSTRLSIKTLWSLQDQIKALSAHYNIAPSERLGALTEAKTKFEGLSPEFRYLIAYKTLQELEFVRHLKPQVPSGGLGTAKDAVRKSADYSNKKERLLKVMQQAFDEVRNDTAAIARLKHIIPPLNKLFQQQYLAIKEHSSYVSTEERDLPDPDFQLPTELAPPAAVDSSGLELPDVEKEQPVAAIVKKQPKQSPSFAATVVEIAKGIVEEPLVNALVLSERAQELCQTGVATVSTWISSMWQRSLHAETSPPDSAVVTLEAEPTAETTPPPASPVLDNLMHQLDEAQTELLKNLTATDREAIKTLLEEKLPADQQVYQQAQQALLNKLSEINGTATFQRFGILKNDDEASNTRVQYFVYYWTISAYFHSNGVWDNPKRYQYNIAELMAKLKELPVSLQYYFYLDAIISLLKRLIEKGVHTLAADRHAFSVLDDLLQGLADIYMQVPTFESAQTEKHHELLKTVKSLVDQIAICPALVQSNHQGNTALSSRITKLQSCSQKFQDLYNENAWTNFFVNNNFDTQILPMGMKAALMASPYPSELEAAYQELGQHFINGAMLSETSDDKAQIIALFLQLRQRITLQIGVCSDLKKGVFKSAEVINKRIADLKEIGKAADHAITCYLRGSEPIDMLTSSSTQILSSTEFYSDLSLGSRILQYLYNLVVKLFSLPPLELAPTGDIPTPDFKRNRFFQEKVVDVEARNVGRLAKDLFKAMKPGAAASA
jgi:hypothetical protein